MTRQEFDSALMTAPFSNGSLRLHDAEQRQRIEELEEWKRIVLGTGTDQEAAIRMAATEYTKVAVQAWKEKVAQLERQNAALREALEGWQSLFRRAVSIAGGLTNYVEDRPELHHAERALELLEEQAQQALKEVP